MSFLTKTPEEKTATRDLWEAIKAKGKVALRQWTEGSGPDPSGSSVKNVPAPAFIDVFLPSG